MKKKRKSHVTIKYYNKYYKIKIRDLIKRTFTILHFSKVSTWGIEFLGRTMALFYIHAARISQCVPPREILPGDPRPTIYEYIRAGSKKITTPQAKLKIVTQAKNHIRNNIIKRRKIIEQTDERLFALKYKYKCNKRQNSHSQ